MPWEENVLFRIRKPHVLFRKLVYMLIEPLPWISREILLEELEKERIRGFRTVKPQIIDSEIERISGVIEKRESYLDAVVSIRSWWERVVEIPQRKWYLISPLISKPKTAEEYGDYVPDIYKDPLAPTMENTSLFRELLHEREIERDSYIIWLDHLFMPFPLYPERDQSIDAIPENLREYYSRHSASYEVYEPGKTLQRMQRIAWWKQIEDFELTGDEAKIEDPEYQKEFENYMQHCKDIVQLMHSLQLREFFKRQINSDSLVIAYAFNKHFEPFNLIAELYDESQGITQYYPNPEIVGLQPETGRTVFVNPIADVSGSDYVEKVMKQSLQYKGGLEQLKTIIRNMR